jgi:hypothetical protein
MVEGRRRIERTRAARSEGLIGRFPNGRRRRDQSKLSSDKKIARAQRIIETIVEVKMAQKAALPAKSWDSLSRGEKLSSNADLSLDVTRRILELGVDPSDPKTLALVKDVALSTIGFQLKAETARLPGATGKPSGGDFEFRISFPEPRQEEAGTIDMAPEPAER